MHMLTACALLLQQSTTASADALTHASAVTCLLSEAEAAAGTQQHTLQHFWTSLLLE